MVPAPTLPRNVEPELLAALDDARVVAVTGPRQSGKTTLVRAVATQRGGRYLSMDDARIAAALRSDPFGMLAGPYPVVIDEFHLAGDPLLRAIKQLVDEDDARGRFLLTGSAHFLTVPRLAESLAGRIRLLEMWPFSQGELRRRRDRFADRMFGRSEALRRVRLEPVGRGEVMRAVCTGGFPEAVAGSVRARRGWFTDYVRTVTQRDIRSLSSLHRAEDLPQLLALLAARTAQEINYNEISRELSMPRTSLGDYVALLEVVGLWWRAPAWARNLTSKVIKHPKGFVADAGLAASLLRIDAEALLDPTTPAVGPLLETFVAGELARQRVWSDVPYVLRHFRDRQGPEVDLVLEGDDGRVAAVEVKASSTFGKADFRGLELLAERLGSRFTNGVLLYLGDEVLPMGPKLTAMPISALWAA